MIAMQLLIKANYKRLQNYYTLLSLLNHTGLQFDYSTGPDYFWEGPDGKQLVLCCLFHLFFIFYNLLYKNHS